MNILNKFNFWVARKSFSRNFSAGQHVIEINLKPRYFVEKRVLVSWKGKPILFPGELESRIFFADAADNAEQWLVAMNTGDFSQIRKQDEYSNLLEFHLRLWQSPLSYMQKIRMHEKFGDKIENRVYDDIVVFKKIERNSEGISTGAFSVDAIQELKSRIDSGQDENLIRREMEVFCYGETQLSEMEKMDDDMQNLSKSLMGS